MQACRTSAQQWHAEDLLDISGIPITAAIIGGKAYLDALAQASGVSKLGRNSSSPNTHNVIW